MGAAENRIRSKVVVIRGKVDEAIASIAEATEGWQEAVAAKLQEASDILEAAAAAIVAEGEEAPEGEESAEEPPATPAA